MQTMTSLPAPHYDEPDLLAPLPNPKLYKKMRNDFKNPSTKYDVPRIHGIPESAEPSSSNLPSKNNNYKIINDLKTPRSNLENLERKYNFIKLPVIPTIAENPENPESAEKPEKTENFGNLGKPGNLGIPGNLGYPGNLGNPAYPGNLTNPGNPANPGNPGNPENLYSNESMAILMQPVVHRVKSNKNTDNRISVSEVHKHGSYVSFDGEFDQFDDLSRRSNVMRMTINFDPDEPPVNV